MKRRVNDDEISSESEYEDEKSDVEDETAHETKVRLMKKKVKEIKDDLKRRKVENVDEEVNKTLEEVALEKKGKLMKNIAKDCHCPNSAKIVLSKFKYDVTCHAYSVDGKFVFTGSRTGDVIKWDLVTGESLARIKGGRRHSKHKFHCSRVTAIAVCDQYVATGDLENKIFIWNLSDLSLNTVLRKHRKPITSLVYRRDTQQLFSGDKKGIIHVWDMTLMASIEELLGHNGEITGLDSNFANNCVSCSGIGDLTVNLWKLDNSSMLTYSIPKGHNELSLECITMINERYFVAGSASNKLYLWDSVNKKSAICVVSPAHTKPERQDLVVSNDVFVTSVCARKQSTVFASGSNMSEVKIWNLTVRDGDQFVISLLFLLPDIVGCANSLQFSPDGKDLSVALCDQYRNNRMQKRAPHCKSAVNIYKLFE